MPWYQCLIRGENFPGALHKQKAPVGFYTTRVVEASSAEEAEMKALAELKEDQTLRVLKIHRSGTARVFFEEISEMTRKPIRKPSGFTFFTDDSQPMVQADGPRLWRGRDLTWALGI